MRISTADRDRASLLALPRDDDPVFLGDRAPRLRWLSCWLVLDGCGTYLDRSGSDGSAGGGEEARRGVRPLQITPHLVGDNAVAAARPFSTRMADAGVPKRESGAAIALRGHPRLKHRDATLPVPRSRRLQNSDTNLL